MIDAILTWYHAQDPSMQKIVAVGGILIFIQFCLGVVQGFRSTQHSTRDEVWREPLHQSILRRLRGKETSRTIVERPATSGRIEH